MRASTFGKLLRALEVRGVEVLREADGWSSGVRIKAVASMPGPTRPSGSERRPGSVGPLRSMPTRASRDRPEASANPQSEFAFPASLAPPVTSGMQPPVPATRFAGELTGNGLLESVWFDVLVDARGRQRLQGGT